MAEKILKQNKIPGCERLTRPEEIKALSKYLRNIKETLEENTDLEETTLEVPGKTTGQLHDISELPQGKEMLNPNHTIDALETERLDLEDNRIPNLSTYREGLEDKRNPILSDYRENLEDNREVELEDYKDELEDRRETELPNYQDKLEDKRDTILSDFREDLEDSRDIFLSDYKDTLEDSREQKLSDYKDTLEDNRKPSLSNYKDSLEDTREPELSNFLDNLEDNRTPKLSNYQDKLEDKRDTVLSDFREDLEDSREQKLSDFRDDIEDTRDVELSDYKDSITDEREPKLSDHKEIISDIPEPKLPGTVEELGGDSMVISSLPDFKDSIADDRDTTLSDYKDTLTDTREPELSDYKDTIDDTRELELGDTRLDILDEREPTLEDTRIDISDTRDNSLSNARIDITDQREPELSDVRLDIQDDRNPELPDTRLDLEDTRENALSDFRDDLTDERENSLSNYKESFAGEVNEVESLYDAVLGLDDPREPELSDYQEELTDEREPELSDTIIERPDNNEEEARIDGVFPNNEWNTDGSPGYYGSFDDVIPKLVDDREPELEDKVVEGIENSDPTSLFEALRNLNEGDLYNFVLWLYSRDHNGNTDIDSDLEIDSEWKDKISGLISAILDPNNPEHEEKTKPISPRNAHHFEEELFRSISILEETEEDHYREIQAKLSGGSDGGARVKGDYDFIDNNPRTSEESEIEKERAKRHIDKNTVVKKDATFNPKTGTLETDGSPRAYGKYDYINIDKLVDPEGNPIKATDEEIRKFKKHTESEYEDVPDTSIPQDSTELEIEYIRYLAEQSVGIIDNRTERKYLLSEALWKDILTRRSAEVLTGINRDRLPGRSDTWFTALDEIYKLYQNGDFDNAAIKMFSKYIREKPNPINRPRINPVGGIRQTYAFELGNSRYEANKKKGNAGVIGNLWNSIISAGMNAAENFRRELLGVVGYDRSYLFVDNYLTGGGIRTTLSDLCKKNIALVGSVEDLLDTLKDSPYITTPSKFGTIHEGSYGTQTLDSNSYWEVIIEPLCDDYLNGGYSYLPCFNEINVINMAAHGVRTAYNKWVPISNFELQKAKLTTKSVGLYDGEFSFPVSAELTNEIRFTIIDDQYKSWRNYFQKCMDVAVYNSEPHKKGYYDSGGITSVNIPGPFGISIPTELPNVNPENAVTVVDKSIITVAFYKNITFRIRIYIMTPQYSTIRRFDLLCVLKDFAEEYSGDVDSGGVDLNVTFSIVGENPTGADQDIIGDIGNRYADNLIREYYSESIPPIPSYDEPDLLGRVTVIDE